MNYCTSRILSSTESSAAALHLHHSGSGRCRSSSSILGRARSLLMQRLRRTPLLIPTELANGQASIGKLRLSTVDAFWVCKLQGSRRANSVLRCRCLVTRRVFLKH